MNVCIYIIYGRIKIKYKCWWKIKYIIVDDNNVDNIYVFEWKKWIKIFINIKDIKVKYLL